jgi:hypothetical protein
MLLVATMTLTQGESKRAQSEKLKAKNNGQQLAKS